MTEPNDSLDLELDEGEALEPNTDPFYEEDDEAAEEAEVEGDESDERAEAWAKFDETGDPKYLPEREARIFKGFQASITKKQQELSSKLKALDERVAQATKKDDPEPPVPADGTAEEIVEALKARQDWLMRNHKDPRLDGLKEQDEMKAKVEAAVERIRSKPGSTPEIMQEMGKIVDEDPEWAEIQFTTKGQDALFDLARAAVEKRSKTKETRRARASQSERMRPRKAGDVSVKDKLKGMSLDDIVEKSMYGQI